MKKIILLSSFFFLLSSFAYTSEDLQNAQFLANKGIITKQSSTKGYRLDDTITRAEVVGMALKIKGITLPEKYTCKNYFTDVKYDEKNNWICRAVELAADDGIISRANTKARPQDSVTRAEALAIVMKSKGITAPSGATPYTYPYSDVFVGSWQADLILYAAGKGIISNPNIIPLAEGFRVVDNIKPIKFFPNRSATRAEVFGFARNMLSPGINENTSSYAVELGNNPDVNKFPDEPKILYLKQGDTKTKIDRGYIDNSFILGDFLLYNWTLTGGTMIKIFSLKTMELVDSVIWGEISTDNRYIFGCAYEIFCKIFSLEEQRMIYFRSLEFNESDEFSPLIYLGEKNFKGPDKKTIDLNKTSSHIDDKEVLYHYYWLISQGSLKTAYSMRSPSGVTYEKFESLYKNLSEATEFYDNNYQTWQRGNNSITIGDDSEIKNLGNSIYEFLVYTDEGDIKSTYKVVSKVDVKNFTIENISSTKL